MPTDIWLRTGRQCGLCRRYPELMAEVRSPKKNGHPTVEVVINICLACLREIVAAMERAKRN